MESNRTSLVKNIIFIFLPFLLAVVLQYIVSLGDVLVIFLRNVNSDARSVSTRSIGDIMTQDFNQPMNQAYMSVARYALYILCFGIWYYRIIRKNDGDASLKSMMTSCAKRHLSLPAPLYLLVSGYAAQLFVDGILTFCRPVFPDIFSEYDKLVSQVTGASASLPMLAAVIILAPIGEELLFRGLVQHYISYCLPAALSVLFQGILFGLYHGNLIQGIYAFVLGSVLGLLAYRTRSIIPGILLHMIINASILLVPAALFETTARCVITSVISLLVFAGMFLLLLRRYKAADAEENTGV